MNEKYKKPQQILQKSIFRNPRDLFSIEKLSNQNFWRWVYGFAEAALLCLAQHALKLFEAMQKKGPVDLKAYQ